jgi:hypothetical protein
MSAPGKAGAISRCESGPGKAVAGQLEASVACGGSDAEHEARTAGAWGVGVSHEIDKIAEIGRSILSRRSR